MDTSPLPIGLAVSRPAPTAIIETAKRADEGGLYALWSTVTRTNPDAVTSLAVAAAETKRIRIGTSIAPAYPRHPLVMASQALVFADLAPGRFRLGVGPSHRPVIEGVFGIPMDRPLEYMREYVAVLRGLLWEGRSDFDGEFFHVHADLAPGTTPPRIPIFLSALRPNAFRQAGEIADGAISWVCPIPYLVEQALPAMEEGAKSAGRTRPPLVAHVLVAWTTDQQAAQNLGREFLTRYVRLPFYAGMFARAGFPIPEGGAVPDLLIDELVISGDPAQIVDRLRRALATGPDELLVTLLAPEAPEQAESDFIGAVGSHEA